MAQKLSYCGEIARNCDPDRFFLSMFAPPAAREPLWALLAFNHEITKTRDIVSETQLGLIRLQWWRESISAIYTGKTVPKNEILPVLQQAIKEHDLPQDNFETLIYSREFDLEDVLPSSLEGMIKYVHFTNVPLTRLLLKILKQEEDLKLEKIATYYGLIKLLRAVPFHARQRRCYLPENLLLSRNISVNALYDLKPPPALREVVEFICDEIKTDEVVKNKFLRGLQILTTQYKGQIKSLKFNVFSEKMKYPVPFKEIRLLFFLM